MKNKTLFLSAIIIVLILSWFIGSKPANVVKKDENIQFVENQQFIASKEIGTDNKNSFEVELSVKCDTILNNIELLDQNKIEILPKDGVIFSSKKVIAYKGESVFDLLLREMTSAKIHMEFVNTPMYDSAYIEGINNIYEFDAGELSGWMYKVNNIFINYGCSKYKIKENDKIEWVFTCDSGKDVEGKFDE